MPTPGYVWQHPRPGHPRAWCGAARTNNAQQALQLRDSRTDAPGAGCIAGRPIGCRSRLSSPSRTVVEPVAHRGRSRLSIPSGAVVEPAGTSEAGSGCHAHRRPLSSRSTHRGPNPVVEPIGGGCRAGRPIRGQIRLSSPSGAVVEPAGPSEAGSGSQAWCRRRSRRRHRRGRRSSAGKSVASAVPEEVTVTAP